MSVEVSVGPPVLMINRSNAVMVTGRDGSIADQTEQGLYAQDTRLVSVLAYSANGVPWTLLTSGAVSYFAVRVHLVNAAFRTEHGDIPAGVIALEIDRTVGDTITERLCLHNHSTAPARFNLEIAIRSDFADLFEVKAHRFVRRGRIESRWDPATRQLYTTYANRDFHRGVVFRIAEGPARPVYANGRISLAVALDPGEQSEIGCEYVLRLGHPDPSTPVHDPRRHAAERWEEETAHCTASNADLTRFYNQSINDLAALRLVEHDLASDVWMPAAGVPWFLTIFGRDSLITSLQTLPVTRALAKGALRTLAKYQSDTFDDWRDAEPGKILHEMRFGELAHFHLTPHDPYYGTADATPLFLIALHELWLWEGDDALLREFRDTAERCLEWIDRSGDLDGDGFQEYQSRSSQGYEDMSWKDSGVAVVYPDGSEVKSPKGTCELQGYVFDAWLRMAEVFERLGDHDRARGLREKAARLQAQFEARFWCADIGSYAFALDSEKRPVASVASNAGQLLWSGLVRPDRAAHVVRRLQEADMWTGWGIRTLSADNPAYNPFAYQRGSVWPHDNGIIALGMKRYGFACDAGRVAHDLLLAVRAFVSYRMPELFAGVERRPDGFPVQYRGANVPQAWAAGSVFHLVRALTGLQAAAPDHTVFVDPELPEWLTELTLEAVRVGGASVDLHCWRDKDQTRWDAAVRSGAIEVKQRRLMPWTIPGVDVRNGERRHAA